MLGNFSLFVHVIHHKSFHCFESNSDLSFEGNSELQNMHNFGVGFPVILSC